MTLWAEYSLNLIALILAEQTMVNEYAGQLFAYSLRKKNCCNGGINTAGKSAQYLAIANLFLQLCNSSSYEGIHLPVASTLTYLVNEVTQHSSTLNGVHNLRMELNSIEIFSLIFHSCHRANRSRSRNIKTSRCFSNIISVTHPADSLS